MPMTFDQFSTCSYRCLYCFSFFQRAIGGSKANYLSGNVRWVNPEAFKRIWTEPDSSQFGVYVKKKIAMQWGGLGDPFCDFERQLGVGLPLIQFLREREYPVRFSTKGTWWTEDERYMELFRGAGKHFAVMFSIITDDEHAAARIEVKAPSPRERYAAMARIAALGVPVILRMRPFIPGVTDKTLEALLTNAANSGATAVSTEFLCIERRAVLAARRLREIGRVAGLDLHDLYVKGSLRHGGYMRLSRELKIPWFEKARDKAHSLGMRFFVSDAQGKELCDGASCCGLPEEWNYQRSQFTRALLIAKEKGLVHWSDFADGLDWAEPVVWEKAEGFNTLGEEARAKWHGFSMKEWMRFQWNSVKSGKGPYQYFGGILYPLREKDEHGDVVYKYCP